MLFKAEFVAILGLCVTISYSQIPPDRNVQSNHEDQILIRGKWFNRNGKSSVPFQYQQTMPQWFQQCMDHSVANGCQTTWRQVQADSVFNVCVLPVMFAIFCKVIVILFRRGTGSEMNSTSPEVLCFLCSEERAQPTEWLMAFIGTIMPRSTMP
jgi:hypothetical protein